MKIRNGFVSNSSSSSFTVIMSPEQEKTWKEQLNVYEKQVVEYDEDYQGVTREEKDFNGQSVIIYSGYTGNADCFEDMSLNLIPEDEELTEEELDEKYDCEFYVSEFWYSAEGKLPDGVLRLSVDF